MRLSIQQGFGRGKRVRIAPISNESTAQRLVFLGQSFSGNNSNLKLRPLTMYSVYEWQGHLNLCDSFFSQRHKSLAPRELRGTRMKDAFYTHIIDCVFRLMFLMKCNMRVASLRSKRKEGDLLHSSPTWFGRAYQSPDSNINHTNSLKRQKSYFPHSCLFTLTTFRVCMLHL